MRSQRLLRPAVALVVVCGVWGCGNSKDDGAKGGTPASPAAGAAATSWIDPKDVLRALRVALEAGDSSRVVALYDGSDPGADMKRKFWAALSEGYAIEYRIRTTYARKFGRAASEADSNPVRNGLGVDLTLGFSFAKLDEARVDEEEGMARVALDKFVFRVARRDGRWAAFREETWGFSENELTMVTNGLPKAKEVLAALEASDDADAFWTRLRAIDAR